MTITGFLTQIVKVAFLLGTLYFLLLSLSNVLWLRLSSRTPRVIRGKKVSVLVPARDEEKNLAQCLESLLDQTYTNYEVVVLDDQSTDGTWHVISDFQKRYPGKVRGVRGEPLREEGWLGKPHAMQQLSRHATGEYLMFTDADTVHGRQSISWAVTNMEAHHADCVSGYVSQEMNTLGERCIVPVMYLMSAMFLPLWAVTTSSLPGISFAIGQVIVFRRAAFEAIGGYESVRGKITDDLAIAHELKKAGFREVFLDLRNYVRCRMYDGYRASFNGISKNIYDVARNYTFLFAVAATMLVTFAVLPLVLLPVQILSGSPMAGFTLLCIALFLLSWAIALWDRGMPWWTPLLYPVLFLHLLYMAWWSSAHAITGEGVSWKGRIVR